MRRYLLPLYPVLFASFPLTLFIILDLLFSYLGNVVGFFNWDLGTFTGFCTVVLIFISTFDLVVRASSEPDRVYRLFKLDFSLGITCVHIQLYFEVTVGQGIISSNHKVWFHYYPIRLRPETRNPSPETRRLTPENVSELGTSSDCPLIVD